MHYHYISHETILQQIANSCKHFIFCLILTLASPANTKVKKKNQTYLSPKIFCIDLCNLLYIYLQDTNSMRELSCAQVYPLTQYFHLKISKNISGKTQTESQSELTNVSLRKLFCVYTLNFRCEFSCL